MVAKNKTKNTAAFSQLGNLYQYLVVVEKCLDLEEGEIINIELKGDVTHADYQYELKHHKDPKHILNDTHIDFWKTLYNWVEDRKLLDQYANFVLLTSSCVRENSLVGDWNNLNETDKYTRLSELYEKIINSDKEYKSINKYVKKVFSFNGEYTHNSLTDLLGKITIKHSYDTAVELLKKLHKHKALLAIPHTSKSSVLISLLGFIASKGITSTAKWDIEVSEFHEFYRDRAEEIRNNELIEYPDLANLDIGDQFKDHRFIREIHKIPYPQKIPLAAKDYYFTSLTLGRIADQNPHAIIGIQSEVEQIGIELGTKKDNVVLGVEETSEETLIKNSKLLYNDALLNLKASEKYSKGARKEFHRGLIHTHVDTSDFQWRIKESDVED